MKDVRVSSINVKGGKKVLARIQRNTDLLTGIIEICKQSNMVTAEINTCIGSLRSGEISWTKASSKTKRGSERTPPIPIEGPLEFIIGQGLVCLADEKKPVVHFHGAVTDPDGKVWAGHFFQGGNPVHSTMDVIITEIDGAIMSFEYDEELDFELAIPKTSE